MTEILSSRRWLFACFLALGVSLSAFQSLANDPPTISSFADRSMAANSTSSFIQFTISDLETAVSSLMVSATSSDTNLVASSGFSFTGSTGTRFLRITPRTNQMGVTIIEVKVTDGGGASANSGFVLTVSNSSPTISDIPNSMANAGVTSAPSFFVVNDKENSPSTLGLVGQSSDTNLVPNGNIYFGGSSSNRNVRVLPVLALGTTTISVTVTDAFGASASDTFQLTISNSPPLISGLSTYNIPMNWTNPPASFVIGDIETPASNLILSAYSANPSLIPNGNFTFGGSGINRTITAWPASNQVGTANLAVVVTDQFGGRATNSLTVNVSQFLELTNSLPGYSYGAIAWGDYNNDGWLDFAVMGTGPAATVIYRNNGDGSFTDIAANLQGISYGNLAWADYDRDGDLDLIVGGLTDAGTNFTQLYRNDGDGVFSAVSIPVLPALRYCSFAWGDYDNDGDPDLIVGGESNYVAVTKLLRNDNGTFVESGISLPALRSSVFAWGDYDNDGDLDLLISGINDDNSAVARVYRNAGNGTFVNIIAPLDGLCCGSAAWGDYDGDGRLDILLHGGDNSGAGNTAIYRNESSDKFLRQTNAGVDLLARVGAVWGDYDNDGDLDLGIGVRYAYFAPQYYRNDGGIYFDSSNNVNGLGQGALAWGDYNNDGKLDLLQTGETPVYTRTTRIFKNYGPVANIAPSAPSDLAATVTGRGVRLSWSAATDANQSAPLTYNVRVGTVPGSGNVLSPMSLADGRRLLPADGNVFHNLSWSLRSLPSGTYYWSVQAVDHGFLASAFATEGSFVISSPPGQPSATTEAVTAITFKDAILNGIANPNGLASTAWFDYGTTTAYGFKTVAQSIGNATSDVSMTRPINGLTALTTYHVRLAVGNSAGTNFGVDRVFTTPAFTPFSLVPIAFPEIRAQGAVWADFDNDNDLDLLMSGNTGDTYLSYNTILMRNQGGGVFTNTGASLGVTGLGILGDYNRDNYVDIFSGTNVFRNAQDGSFVLIPLSLGLPFAPYEISRMAWGDFDNDGDLDLYANRNYYGYSVLRRNDGNGIFSPVDSILPHLSDGSPSWLDYDNDGRLDFLLLYSTGEASTGLFHNNGNYTFVDSGNFFTNSSGSAVDWGDCDNDGDLDLVFGGGTYPFTPKIFLNDGHGTFRDSGVTNLPLSVTRVLWGDYDNDGDLDLLVVGPKPSLDYQTSLRVFRNDGGTFSDTGFEIVDVEITAAAWVDYDNDGDLDIFVSGLDKGYQRFARLYRNNSLISNSPPAAPSDLQASVTGKDILLTWNKPFDLNQTNGFSYNLRVSTTPGGTDIMSPLANLQTGFRRLPRFGNAGVGTNWVLTNLLVGTYYWSVQAVDNSFAGSPFAAEKAFVVPPWPPDVIAAWATNLTLVQATLYGTVNPNNRPTTVQFQYGLTTNYNLTSSAVILPGVNVSLTTNFLISGLSPETSYHYRLMASNGLGVSYSVDQTFKTPLFTQMPTNFNILAHDSGLWGDFDGDGILDAVFEGSRDGFSITGVFHNDGAGNFTELNTGVPYGGYHAQAANLDRDEDLDLIFLGSNRPFYTNNGVAFFGNITNSLGFEAYSVSIADIDNDGDIDLLVTGYDAVSSRDSIKLLTNNGSGVFLDNGAHLIDCRTAIMAWSDADNDGDADLAMIGSGWSSSTNFACLYRNDGPAGFTPIFGLFPVVSGSMAWGDYDNDGDDDLVLTGAFGQNDLRTRIYRNDGNLNFTEIDPGIPGFYSGSVQWGDFDNDGHLDLLFSGNGTNYPPLCQIYRNLGGDTFALADIALPGFSYGTAAWGDYDQDGDLDILLAGQYIAATIFRNNCLTPNAIPQAPTNLSATVIAGNSARLSWQPGLDANQSSGHTFNIRVGTAPGQGNVLSALSVSSGGKRRIPAPGNVWHNTSWLIKALVPGTYYWSVQAVDNSLAGSPFAAEQSFVVAPFAQPPTVITMPATNVSFFTSTVAANANPNGVASSAYFEFGLTTNYGSATPLQALGNGTNELSISAALSRLTANTLYHYRIVGTNFNGTSYGLDKTFTTPVYVEFNQFTSFPEFYQGSVAWGDYDNDGDLDLLFTGLAYISGSRTTSLVYRNDNGTFVAVPMGLKGTWQGDAVWGDYDNDGDLDIALCGNSDCCGNIARIYRNDGSNVFTELPVVLPAVYEGKLAWADFDRDGDLDLLLVSSSGSGVYRNDGHDTFVLSASLPAVLSPGIGVADFDNDGDQDILMTGYSGGAITQFYVNDGAGNFSLLNTSLPNVSDGSVAWGDFDNDGDLDLALTGSQWTYPASYLTVIYRNDGGGVFTDVQAGLPGVYEGSCAWGDYDNDGNLDLLLNGSPLSANDTAKLFRNLGSGSFIDTGNSFQPFHTGRAVWGDYDNDRDLDIATSGTSNARIYRNNATNSNVIASAPTALVAFPTSHSVTLVWSPSIDPNQARGITYNVRVGTSPAGINVLSPMADPSTGFRRVAQLGNAGLLQSLTLTNLVSGTYYWSVQAIDHSFAGSAFAAERSFTISNTPPVALSQSLTLAEDTSLPISLTGADADNDPLSFSIVSSPLFGQLTGTPPQLTYSPRNNFFGFDQFTFRVDDGATSSTPATVFLQITGVPDVLTPTLGIQLLPSRQMQLSLVAEPWQAYQIEVSDDLIHWIALTNVTSTNLIAALIDADAPRFPRRFYRATLFRPSLGPPSRASSNQFILTLIGTPGLNYQLQTSTNLINWNVLTNVLLTNSTASFIDSDILNYPRRFYRLLGP